MNPNSVERDSPSKKNVVFATRLAPRDAAFVVGACQERGVTMAQFLREAAIEYAMRESLWGDKPEALHPGADDVVAARTV